MSSSNNGSVISKIKFPHPAWRYLLLFQSWSQLQSWSALILGTIIIINGIIIFFGVKLLPLEGVLAGAIIGSLCSLFTVLPAEFELSQCSIKLLALVKSEIESLGYVQRESEKGLTVYQQNLPKIFRWQEGNVCVTQSGVNVNVRGAFIIVLKVQRSLLKYQANEYA